MLENKVIFPIEEFKNSPITKISKTFTFWVNFEENNTQASISLKFKIEESAPDLDLKILLTENTPRSLETIFNRKFNLKLFLNEIQLDIKDYFPLSNNPKPATIHTRIWYFVRISLIYDQVEDKIFPEVEILSSNPPFSTRILFSPIYKNPAYSIISNTGILPKNLEITGRGRISDFRVYSGYFGLGIGIGGIPGMYTTTQVSNTRLDFCEQSILKNWIFFKTNTFSLLNENDCLFCSIPEKLTYEAGKHFNTFSLVWNGQICAYRCKKWQRIKRQTAQCWGYLPNLDLQPELSFSQTKIDSYKCGDGFVDFGETCEYNGLDQIQNDCERETCQLKSTIKQKILCWTSVIGKSRCMECSLSLCNNNKLLIKGCLETCGYYYKDSQFWLSSKIGSKKVYIDPIKQSFENCSAFAFNVEGKIKLRDGKYPGFKFCRKCFRGDNPSIKNLYKQDIDFHLCFPIEEQQPIGNSSSFFLFSLEAIKVAKFFPIFATLFLLIATPFLLSPTNTSLIFYSYWELLQIHYLWSFKLEDDSPARQIFRQLNFINYETILTHGFFSRLFIKLLLKDKRDEARLRFFTEESRSLMTSKQYAKFQVAFYKYFRNGKICIFLYDFGAIIDLLIICFVITFLVSLVYYLIGLCITSENSKLLRFLKWSKKMVSEKMYKRLVQESAPIIFFNFLNQELMFVPGAEQIYGTFFLINRQLAWILTLGCVFGPTVYSLAVVLGIHRDKRMLNSILKGSGRKVAQNKSAVVIHFLSSLRKIVFVLMFVPALQNVTHSAWSGFFILILQFGIFSLMTSTTPYENKVIARSQLLANLILLFSVFILICDTLSENLKLLSISRRSVKTLRIYTYTREYYLVLSFFFIIFIYLVSALLVIFMEQRKIKNYYYKLIFGKELDLGFEEDDGENDDDGKKMIELVNLV